MYEYTHIMTTQEFGRGVYALCDIPQGTIIERAHILVLSEADTIAIRNTDLKYYDFNYNDKQACLVLGNGELYNHSDTPNLRYDLVSCGGHERMVFVTTKPVKAGEQLFTNYNQDDTSVNPKDYTVNLI